MEAVGGTVANLVSIAISAVVPGATDTVVGVTAASVATRYTTDQIGQSLLNQLFYRERLSADRTYYVATTGSDSNSGLTSGAPFLTVQKAVDTVCNSLDISGFDVTIQVAAGTYTDSVTLSGYTGATPTVAGTLTYGGPKILGDNVTPSNIVFSTTSNCIKTTPQFGLWVIDGIKFTSSAGLAIRTDGIGALTVLNVNFGACTAGHMNANVGQILLLGSAYTISGSAAVHAGPSGNAAFIAMYATTVTLSGTPAFSDAFAACELGAWIDAISTFAGTGATGKRYRSDSLGVLNTYGSGANYFPGDTPGTTSTGGQYL